MAKRVQRKSIGFLKFIRFIKILEFIEG